VADESGRSDELADELAEIGVLSEASPESKKLLDGTKAAPPSGGKRCTRTPPAKSDLQSMFSRYDLNNGGTLDTTRELYQLTTNVLYSTRFNAANATDWVSNQVQAANVESAPMDLDAFAEWFINIFDYSWGGDASAVGEQDVWVQESGEKRHAVLEPVCKSSDVECTTVVTQAHRPEKSLQRFTVRFTGSTLDPPEDCVVAFDKVEHLCNEGDGKCVMHVIRRGSTQFAVTLDWHTTNVSVAPHSYKDQRGTVTLEAGKASTTFELSIMDNMEWNCACVQHVTLTNPVPAENVQFGELVTTSVVILDDDAFPYGEEDHASNFKVVVAFARQMMVFLWPETWRGMIIMAFPAIVWLTTQLMIDLALNHAFKNDEKADIYVMSVMYMVVLVINHMMQIWKDEQRLDGKGRLILRSAAVETSLQLTALSSEIFPAGTVMGIIAEDIAEVLDKCWIGLFKFWGQVVQIIVLIAWTAYITRESPALLLIPLSQFVCNVVVLYFRINEQIRLHTNFINTDDHWKDAVMEWASLKDLIIAYRQGLGIGNKFVDIHKKSNAQGFKLNQNTTTTNAILKYISGFFTISGYIIAGNLVFSGDYKPSNFMLLMSTIFKFDAAAALVCDTGFSCMCGAVPIVKMAKLFNSKTRRTALLNGEKRRARILGQMEGSDETANFDPTAINFIDVIYDREVSKAQELEKTDDCVASDEAVEDDDQLQVGPISLSLPQGTVIAITGKQKGKRTLLMLLARFVLPTDGILVYPSNLRVRYVPVEPLLIQGSVMDNLRFGNMKQHADQEILALASLVGLSKRLLHDPDTPVGLGGQRLSTTERISVCLARALLSSVDLLLLGSTLDVLTFDQAESVVKLLRRWVEDRGMDCLAAENNGVPINLKKQKTVFYVTHTKSLDEHADVVLELKEAGPVVTEGEKKVSS